MPHRAPIHPWEHGSKQWTRIHVDYAGPFRGMMYLIIMDSYSKWLDVYPVSSASTQVTIEKLRMLFATHGLSEILVSDNASCFRSEEFGEFMNRNNIRHVTGAPYKPETNGLAERAMQTFKRSLKKLVETNTFNATIQTLFSRLLFSYQITPHSSTGVSPAELLMGRKLNSVLSTIKPNKGRRWRMKNDKDFYANAALCQFSIGDLVWVRNYANGPKWISGVVERIAGPVSYEICARGCLISRHVDQIRLRVTDDLPVSNGERMSPTPETPTSDTSHVDMANDRMQETLLTNNTTPLSVHPTGIPPAVPGSPGNPRVDVDTESTLWSADKPMLRRSTRERRPPQYLGIDD